VLTGCRNWTKLAIKLRPGTTCFGNPHNEASRNARGDHDVNVESDAGDAIDLVAFCGSLVQTVPVPSIKGWHFQVSFGSVATGIGPAVRRRNCFSVFVDPAYADRVWPVLAGQLAATEYADAATPLAARHLAHFASALLRAREAAVRAGTARDFFQLRDGEALDFPDIANRFATAAFYGATATLPPVDVSMVANHVSVEAAIRRGTWPVFLTFADGRMSRTATDAGGAHHKLLALLDTKIATCGGSHRTPSGQCAALHRRR
jgi:hypothetical protein